MANHLNKFDTLINQAISVGMTQDDDNKVILLLCSLPRSWDGVVTAIRTSMSSKNKLVFNDVVAILLSEDMRRNNQEPAFGDTLTMVSIENRGRNHDRGKNSNRRRSKSSKRSKSRGRNGECWFCGKARHTKKNFQSYKKAQEKVWANEANTTYEKDDSFLILSTTITTPYSWVLDSGASYHATSCT